MILHDNFNLFIAVLTSSFLILSPSRFTNCPPRSHFLYSSITNIEYIIINNNITIHHTNLRAVSLVLLTLMTSLIGGIA